MKSQYQYHILNGDALKNRFPAKIEGSVIVVRECLVDGPVAGWEISELFTIRAEFINREYSDSRSGSYQDLVINEFAKIAGIPPHAEINLWFEYDLFCQVNFWFVIYWLNQHHMQSNMFFIQPTSDLDYGFSGMQDDELFEAFHNRQKISAQDSDALGSLWTMYQNNHTEEMMRIAKHLYPDFPFLIQTINAHIDRFPYGKDPGKPIRTLHAIMSELDTKDFALIFKEFSKREPVYGFGDLQVRRLLQTITDQE